VVVARIYHGFGDTIPFVDEQNERSAVTDCKPRNFQVVFGQNPLHLRTPRIQLLTSHHTTATQSCDSPTKEEARNEEGVTSLAEVYDLGVKFGSALRTEHTTKNII
jgi:hypothetical protein